MYWQNQTDVTQELLTLALCNTFHREWWMKCHFMLRFSSCLLSEENKCSVSCVFSLAVERKCPFCVYYALNSQCFNSVFKQQMRFCLDVSRLLLTDPELPLPFDLLQTCVIYWLLFGLYWHIIYIDLFCWLFVCNFFCSFENLSSQVEVHSLLLRTF